MESQNLNEIVLFDGVCNLCSSSVQFVLKKEKEPRLKFASLQSETGKQLLKKYQVDSSKVDSIVFIKNDKAYIKSGAALRLTTYLRGLYPALYGFLIIPPFIRNWFYDWIAAHRYKWFGKTEACMIPNPELRSRFV